MTSPLLEVRDLSIFFPANKLEAVSKLSFSLEPGKTLAIVGESGSGKSLTALSAMQLLPKGAYLSEQSKILYKGIDLLSKTEKEMRDIRGCKISLVFQEALVALNPVLRIGDQLLECFKTKQNLSKKDRLEKSYSLLEEVGLENPKQCFKSYPFELSGGMQQRCVIAMAIAGDPEVLIADEPTTALDVNIQAKILELLYSLKEKRKMSMLFISHDLAVVSDVADDILLLKKGKEIEKSPCRAFFNDPQSNYARTLLSSIPDTKSRQVPLEETNKILSVHDLKVHFPIKKGLLKRTVDHVKAVDGISFNLKKGETVALVGQSGSGKTTAAMALLNLQKKTSGEEVLEGEKINPESSFSQKFLRQNMQVIFQDPYASLNPRAYVFDSMIEGLLAQKRIKKREDGIPIVDRLLEQVGLSPEVKWRYPHEFSGGEKQRICIARALTLRPKLLVLDEPTSALDVTVQMQILKLLEDLQKKRGLSYLLITHNLGVVSYLAHRTLVMYKGKIVEQGETKKLLESPEHPYTKKLLEAMPLIKNEL